VKLFLPDRPRVVSFYYRNPILSRARLAHITAMHIPDRFATLWYENDNGDRWYPDYEHDRPPQEPPAGFIYQHSRFPCELNHTILRCIVPQEVEKCPHPEEDVVKTYGWVDGVEGRECRRCGGKQMRKTGEEWPETWDANGSKEFMSMRNGFAGDLALALATNMQWPLDKAILVAAIACERCMNALAHKCGLDWGYPEDSEDYITSTTRCELCEQTKDTVVAQCGVAIPEGLRFPYVHPAVQEQIQDVVQKATSLYYQPSIDFLTKTLEDWACQGWHLPKLLPMTGQDDSDVVSISVQPDSITVSFFGIPKLKSDDPVELGKMLDAIIGVVPNKYLAINKDVLLSTLSMLKNITDQRVVYAALLSSYPNNAFEEHNLSTLLQYPKLPMLSEIIGEPIDLQYYTTPARRAAWAVMQHNPQWGKYPDTMDRFVTWFSNNFTKILQNTAYVTTDLSLYEHQVGVTVPTDEFIDGVIDSMENDERVARLEETPVIMQDLGGKQHMLSGIYRRRMFARGDDTTFKVWLCNAADVWRAFRSGC